VSTVTSGGAAPGDIGLRTCGASNGETTMAKKPNKGIPALRNEDLTGMTKEKQEEVIEESGQAPRSRAAEEFYEEGEKQAAQTEPSGEEGE
jgi:hypothetical protein